jgi:photosystem II stability/assembly factor-like uncharacterized protein
VIHQRSRTLAAALLASAFAATAVQAQIPVATEFESLHFRSVGPATMSGRIADVAVYEANPAVYYVGTAHGGVWKTTSNGATWTPLLQHEGLMSIGDVTISQTNPDLLWVGTGESNNRQSISWGEGVYKSTDGGKTFTHMGLRNSKHINEIVIDPTNNDIVYVAATGPLWGSGGERGVYKTIDGGETWRLILKGDDDTGANDVVMSAANPKVLFASMYQRRRTTCCMNGGGTGSALFKSVDGGENWTKVGGGYPTGELGRIAVDIAPSDPSIVYSLVEAPSAVPLDSGKTGLWRSNDAGATWRKVSNTNPRPMYFSKLRIDPSNAETVYYGGVGLQMSIDGGKSVETDAAMVTHDDVHAIWVNPRNPQHVLIGNDGGLAVSYDQAKSWTFVPNLPVGLFYHVSYDMERPFNICGGMQDNYNWCGPSASRHGAGIYNYDWFQILGGDGFVALPDHRDSRIVYTESQDGNLIRRNTVTGESRSIRPTPLNVTPAPAAGEAFRFHWDTPLIRSPHNPGVLYVGANRVFRTDNRGDSWAMISPDLTRNQSRNDLITMGVKNSDIKLARNDGISAWPAVVALAESPRAAGLLYAGTDDGVVQMTRDAGKTWTDITSRLTGFPANAFVAEVVPSAHAAGTVYVAVDNHRENDYNPYIWVSNDFGATFRRIDSGLAGEVVHTITEDHRNADVLYAGTESGIFLTVDRGKTWRRLKANFPTVRVDEITLHHRDNAMLVASHGRSIWVLDHLEPIQEYAATQSAAQSRLFTVPTALQWKFKDDRNDEFWGHQTFIGENPPTDAVIQFNVKGAAKEFTLRISRGANVIREIPVPAAKNRPGIQTVCWDQRTAPIPAAAGPQPGGPGGRGGAGGGQFGGGPGRGASGTRCACTVAHRRVSAAQPLCGGWSGWGLRRLRRRRRQCRPVRHARHVYRCTRRRRQRRRQQAAHHRHGSGSREALHGLGAHRVRQGRERPARIADQRLGHRGEAHDARDAGRDHGFEDRLHGVRHTGDEVALRRLQEGVRRSPREVRGAAGSSTGCGGAGRWWSGCRWPRRWRWRWLRRRIRRSEQRTRPRRTGEGAAGRRVGDAECREPQAGRRREQGARRCDEGSRCLDGQDRRSERDPENYGSRHHDALVSFWGITGGASYRARPRSFS